MSIDERIRVVADRKARKVHSYCAAKNLKAQALQNLYYRLLKAEYINTPDDKKEQWLNDEETA